ncbi:hypothetical protein OQJ15_02825 [Fluoribacter dumoffii]|uniref:Uncharacterized protein n=1 Tax=Fluoribacter dumoffii TaxID=463 RepID=A0A377G8A7_9GAMM|nr:hypothetical protein [Fluoribacter dumoffii]KTC89937.1 hypothetical protein Ldum_1005 [Fluoribacter dumoffii NY 23]MCW8385235.1 hypothetical protein [Fluoribacter dumoffii]MCW8496468.1 hypothetical protein [Fluoribacter dumoffii]STO21055.1 Uncharacterised protein [Fluoribacter dumoffii]
MFAWIRCFLFLFVFHISTGVSAAEIKSIAQQPVQVQSIDSTVGSWTFTGMVTNESGDKYGYFFEMQRQGADFHTKAALIDEETNKLVFFYENKEKIEQPTPLDWQIGYSFIRYNPINDSWIFGVKTADKKGFNFKVDMLKQANNNNENLVLRPGIKFQVLQTSQLNGHVRIDDKEQFVTGNKAWFGKLVLNNGQKDSHEINTTFCRLNDDNGFYSANLKEKDASSAAVAGWLDPSGNKVKMSQFISLKPLDNDQCMLSVGLPKLHLKLLNTLKDNDSLSHSIAGFSKESRGGFCFVTQQSFIKDKTTESGAQEVKLHA